MPRSDRGSIGSATVEFALVLPLVLVVVLALVQVGLLVRDRLLVEAAARAAARAAAVQDDPDAITSAALAAAPGLDPARASVETTRVGERGSRSRSASSTRRRSASRSWDGSSVPA